MSLFHFKNILVRELAWVMCSPNLLVPDKQSQRHADSLALVWDADCRAYFSRFQESLRQLDDDPRALQDWMAATASPRLGIRFERYLEYWLRWIAPAQEMLKGLTLHEQGGRTLGQMDFLWRDHDNHTRHWEAAVKYYLYWPGDSAWTIGNGLATRWLGPNANDCFEAKISHLLQHQIPIAHSEAAQQALAQRHWDSKVNSAVFLKGYLFYPLAEDDEKRETWRLGGQTKVIAPADHSVNGQCLSQAHLKGWWQKYPYTRLARVSPHSQWLVLPKQYWLAPFAVASQQTLDEMGLNLLDDGQLRRHCDAHFSTSQRSLMLLEILKKDNQLHEIARAMLLHPHWPNLTRY